MKTIAATAMNPQSSRGHTIIKLHMEKRNTDASCTVSDCWVVDLAGRENEKTTQVRGEQFVELSFINKSLMWLAVCIKTLTEEKKSKKQNLSQFRNSKLTLLLANALTGNSKTSVITTASPTMGNYDETLATLKFATSVKCIELKATAATKVDKDQLLSTLQDEVKKLKEQASAAGPSSDEFEELKKRAEIAEQIAREQAANWADLRSQSEEAQKLRQETAKKMNIMRWNMSTTAIKSLLKSPGRASAPLPHLVRESDDPEKEGKPVTFHIAQNDREYVIGHADGCDFKPTGLTEKCPRLCYVWRKGDELWLRVEKVEKRSERVGMSGCSALVLAKFMGVSDPTQVVRNHTQQRTELNEPKAWASTAGVWFAVCELRVWRVSRVWRWRTSAMVCWPILSARGLRRASTVQCAMFCLWCLVFQVRRPTMKDSQTDQSWMHGVSIHTPAALHSLTNFALSCADPFKKRTFPTERAACVRIPPRCVGQLLAPRQPQLVRPV